jgi:hypothetical protein
VFEAGLIIVVEAITAEAGAGVPSGAIVGLVAVGVATPAAGMGVGSGLDCGFAVNHLINNQKETKPEVATVPSLTVLSFIIHGI